MPAPTPIPKVAKPTKSIFDPFNSSATGHQRADNRLSGSTSWRDSRSTKLREQFSADAGGGKRISDTVGAGSLDFGQDGRTEDGGWVVGAKGLRTNGQTSIWESMKVEKEVERPAKRVKLEDLQSKPTCVVNPYTPFRKPDGTIRETSWTSHESSPSHLLSPLDHTEPSPPEITTKSEAATADSSLEATQACPQIFAGLNMYINGSTMPYMSDHKLKRLLSEHGANMSIFLGRKTVTHIVIGKPGGAGGGCGGGLAGTKIHKEVTRVGGKAVKYVTAEWIVKSIAAGKRLPESKFEAMRLAPKGVASVLEMFAARQNVAGVKRSEPG
nr:hypothetical protein B0A51_00964 [Rachicladosporium sp. CCFEE 5018]